jgi:hypothetical protein
MAQEIVHNYNGDPNFNSRWVHVNCGSGVSGTNPNYPYPTDQIGITGTRNTWGFDQISRAIIQPDQASDYMSYCTPVWTSDYTWIGALNVTNNTPRITAPSADTLSIAGLVAADQASALFTIIHRTAAGVLRAASTASPQHTDNLTGTYRLELLSATNSVLASQIVTPTEGTHDATDFPFFATMPYASGATALRLTRNNLELTRRTISANAPIVTVTQPIASANMSNTLMIAWTASDADGDALNYLVQYSADNGVTWNVIANGLSGTTLTVTNTNDLPGSNTARVRVVANDGVNTGMATSAAFTLQGHAPRPFINQPSDRAVFSHDTPVVLNGQALDMEEGALSGAALQWRITGPTTRTGSGQQLTFYNLSPGAYTTWLTATDSTNKTSSLTSTFTISPKRVYEASTPTLDGFCDDTAYNSELEPITLRYSNGEVAQVRFVHAGSALYACFVGMLVGTNAGEFAGLKIDVNNSGGNVIQTTDRVFYVYEDGSVTTGIGNGAGGETYDATPQGASAAVSQNNGYWNVELRIDDGRIGGWNHFVKLRPAHFWRNFVGDDTVWTDQSIYNQPATWGLVALGKQSQTITFPTPPDHTVGELPFSVNASASSSLPISFTSNTPTVCVVSDNVVTVLSMGTCTLVAAQAGSGSYNAATNVTRSFNVAANNRVYLPLVVR